MISSQDPTRPREHAEDDRLSVEEASTPGAQRPQDTRRSALRALGKLGLGAAVGALPMMASPRPARAQSMEVTDVLNFALALEYLEATYYQQGIDTGGLIPGGDADEVYSLITEHENEHVALLQTALGDAALSADAVTFDFTGARGGMQEALFDPFNNYDQFLLLSQGFEDTGVRAYKGQAASIPGDAQVAGLNVLTTALQIHSVEARHAAEVRRLRAMNGMLDDLQPWVHEDGVYDAPLSSVYAGEGNTMQVVELTSALSGDYSDEQIAEAFDEPLTMEEVIAIAQLFIVEDLGEVF